MDNDLLAAVRKADDAAFAVRQARIENERAQTNLVESLMELQNPTLLRPRMAMVRNYLANQKSR